MESQLFVFFKTEDLGRAQPVLVLFTYLPLFFSIGATVAALVLTDQVGEFQWQASKKARVPKMSSEPEAQPMMANQRGDEENPQHSRNPQTQHRLAEDLKPIRSRDGLKQTGTSQDVLKHYGIRRSWDKVIVYCESWL